MQHQCIKCKNKYEDSDEDDYLCDLCRTERQRIAKEIDAKRAGRISEPVESELQQYDRQLREAREKGGRFPSIHDLGISL